MKIAYFPDTDSMHIEFSDNPGVNCDEISLGVAVDYDSGGNITGIDIDNAGRKIDINTLILDHLPIQNQTIAAQVRFGNTQGNIFRVSAGELYRSPGPIPRRHRLPQGNTPVVRRNPAMGQYGEAAGVKQVAKPFVCDP